jgi:hypothetical protein
MLITLVKHQYSVYHSISPHKHDNIWVSILDTSCIYKFLDWTMACWNDVSMERMLHDGGEVKLLCTLERLPPVLGATCHHRCTLKRPPLPQYKPCGMVRNCPFNFLNKLSCCHRTRGGDFYTSRHGLGLPWIEGVREESRGCQVLLRHVEGWV